MVEMEMKKMKNELLANEWRVRHGKEKEHDYGFNAAGTMEGGHISNTNMIGLDHGNMAKVTGLKKERWKRWAREGGGKTNDLTWRILIYRKRSGDGFEQDSNLVGKKQKIVVAFDTSSIKISVIQEGFPACRIK
ncbi:hypothetical protein QYF36_009223 [Acer negundo]|nr:hypothetical protein QYF36_009223 [Acer negundo]